MKPPTKDHDTILFDGHCGMCSTTERSFKHFLLRHGFRTVALQSKEGQQLFSADGVECLEDIRIVTADGVLHSGADAYRFIATKVWWLKPIGGISIIPPIRQLFDLAYRIINRNRYRISKVCDLKQAIRD